MSLATKEQWERTIQRWEGIVKDPNNRSEDNCVFCILGCSKCPIYAFTGQDECEATPYYKVLSAAMEDKPNKAKKQSKKMLKLLKEIRAWDEK